jgi:hypothetical protein
VGLIVAQAFVRGLLNVLLVTVSIHLVRAGDSGLGFLNSGFGAGALVGGLSGVSLLGRRRLADPFGLGLVPWGRRSPSSWSGPPSAARSSVWRW